MPKKQKPLRGEPVRGGETLTIAGIGYKRNIIPVAAIDSLEHELTGLAHGTASLVIHVRDNRITRFVVGRERSVALFEG